MFLFLKSVDLSGIREYDRKASLLRIALSFNSPSVTVPVEKCSKFCFVSITIQKICSGHYLPRKYTFKTIILRINQAISIRCE